MDEDSFPRSPVLAPSLDKWGHLGRGSPLHPEQPGMAHSLKQARGQLGWGAF